MVTLMVNHGYPMVEPLRFWQTFTARVYLENQQHSFSSMGASPLLMDGNLARRPDANQQRERLSLATVERGGWGVEVGWLSG